MAPELLHTRLLDNLSTAILLLDEQLNVSYLNPAAESLLELSRSRILGSSIETNFLDDSLDTDPLRRSLNESIGFTKRQTTLDLLSGRTITVDFSATPTHLEKRCLIIEIQPLDRLMRISREEALLSSQQNTRTMLRGLAHEIKNPLGGLRGAAQLLARELDSEQLVDFTNIIIEEADRLRNLVDRMLIAPGKLQRAPVNIHEVLERVVKLVHVETDKRIIIKRNYDPSIPEFSGDREQLIQATLNIARNAVQALLESGIEQPCIEIKTRTQRQFTIGSQRYRLVTQVDMIDNGPGIPTDLQDKIFFPMISGRAEGTGLGLSIAQSIINNHNGLIEFVSQPGETSFSILIPLEDNHE